VKELEEEVLQKVSFLEWIAFEFLQEGEVII
jgi:hypothetical protein